LVAFDIDEPEWAVDAIVGVVADDDRDGGITFGHRGVSLARAGKEKID
jgi:hypothetical protein